MDNWEVEQHFARKLTTAMSTHRYDSFMDFATVLYAKELESYLDKLKRGTIPHQVRSWLDDEQQKWYSLLVQIGGSQLQLELVSPSRPRQVLIIDDDLQRLPASVFRANAVSELSAKVLHPLAVSKAVSNLSATTAFYVNEMLASVNHTSHSTDGTVTLQAIKLQGAEALVRFVQRPSDATSGDFTVRDLEEVKNKAHRMAHMDNFCGVDKYYDNHFAYDQTAIKLDRFKEAFDQHQRIYHIFGDCNSTAIGPGVNIYVVDPTGDSVQIDGKWDQCPQGGSGDALQDACSQGTCQVYQPTAACYEKISLLCAKQHLRNSTCTDCGYLNFVALQAAGCNNADVVNYCTAY